MKRKTTDSLGAEASPAKKSNVEENLPELSYPYQVEVVVRKNETEPWRPLTTTKHAIQKLENDAQHILLHSAPDHSFAIRLTNNDRDAAGFYVTVDGKPTRVSNSLPTGHVVLPNNTRIVEGIETASAISKFVFYKTKIAQDISELDPKLNKTDFGLIKVVVHKATFDRNGLDNSNYTNNATGGNVTLKEQDAKRFGVLATTGTVTPLKRGYTTSFYNRAEKIEKEIYIRYCDTTGMIGK
jgi:hypothetical protein